MARTYHEVATEIRRRIEAGVYGPKSPLPSERTLEQEFDIHRATVRRALNVLVSEGLLTRSPGQRAFPRASGPRTASIGLFAAEPTDLFPRSLIANGISEVLTERRSPYHLVWSNARAFQMETPVQETNELPPDQLCALILWPPAMPSLSRLRQAQGQMPVTLLDVRVAGFQSDFVGFRDFDAGYEAAKHLYELGHRRLAFIGNVVPATAQNRRWGLNRFCEDAGIEPVWKFAGGSGPLDRLPADLQRALVDMPRSEWPTAAICTNDETAALTMSFMTEHGLRVPDDLSLIGFGNSNADILNALGLTTMEQPYTQVGREAAALVLDRLADPDPVESPTEILLPMRLVVRTSCGTVG